MYSVYDGCAKALRPEVCSMYEEHKQSLCLEGGSSEMGSNEVGRVAGLDHAGPCAPQ